MLLLCTSGGFYEMKSDRRIPNRNIVVNAGVGASILEFSTVTWLVDLWKNGDARGSLERLVPWEQRCHSRRFLGVP